MNKKLLIALLIPLICHAEEPPFPSTQRGITIIPVSKQNLPLSMKERIMANKNEEKTNGYILTTDNNAKFLLNIKKHAEDQYNYGDGYKDYGNQDTKMKHNYKEIKLSFPFSTINIPNINIIGYAPIGSFEKDKGWNGIRMFFSEKELGNCSYSRMGILAAQLGEETTEYFVNKKPSNKIIEGNINDGFLYTINWYTNTSIQTLECANMNFNKNIMDKMVKYSIMIDKN
jgi:hypothetical protein